MYLSYDNKKPEQEVIENTEAVALRIDKAYGKAHGESQLIQGDNLRVMKTLLEEGTKIDLVYIDPPFARNTTFRASAGRTATISSSHDDEVAYHDKRTGEEFLEFLRERLILLRELLTPTGSIYVHIDDKIGHYVKILMDEVFGRQNFRNDISRIKSNPKNFSRLAYGNIKDVILFYTKSEKSIWNEPRQDAPEESVSRLFSKIDKLGRRYTTNPLHAPGETKNGESGQPWKGILPPRGRHWRYSQAVLDQLEKEGLIDWSSSNNPRKIIFASDHKTQRMQDVWMFKDPQRPSYPTEKNLAMVKAIILASSNPGQVVMDAFCGSGTTLIAAEEHGRKWIGIDESDMAIRTSLKRLTDLNSFPQGSTSFVLRKRIELSKAA